MASVRLEEGPDGWLTVRIAGALDIYAAESLRDALRPALNGGGAPLGLDLSGVEELDLAGVQVLLWLRATALGDGLKVAVLSASPAVEAAVRTLSLAELERRP